MSDRRTQKTKKAFHTAFLQLLENKTPAQITVSDLVRKADVNRSTFYRHYQEIQDLLDELIHFVLQDLRTAYNDPYQKETDFSLSRLRPEMIKIFEHVYKNRDFYRQVIHAKISPGFQNQICEVIKELALRDALHSHYPTGNANLELLASYQAHAIFGMIVYWAETDFQFSPHYMSEQLYFILNLTRK
ncbi:TetR/AcrR family transcriptional regulator C-terminal domain-containing protein [Listeria aquatica]|uniref:TetR/AcrR family transcriptional regulator n=1 Tax=Listeria aquatica TaxID=1494960 RepID=UPI003F6F89B3